MKRLALEAFVHVSLLAAPAALYGGLDGLVRPRAIACIGVLVALSVAERAARRGRPDTSRLGAPGTASALVSALGLLLTGWCAIASASASASASAWASASACALGIGLRGLAIRALGDAFTSETIIVPGRRIVRDGIYAWLRHPSDVGLLLVAAGLVGLSGSILAALPALLLVVPSVIARTAREDRLLASTN